MMAILQEMHLFTNVKAKAKAKICEYSLMGLPNIMDLIT